MRGRRVTDILPPHICTTVEEGMRRVFKTGEPELFHVHGPPRPEAHGRFWAITVSPVRNPAGEVRHVQVVALDDTEQHRARERLALLNDVSAQVGSTLDVTRTAQEMADVAVGRLADFISIDLLDSLFRGIEPRPPARAPSVCAAQRSSPSFLASPSRWSSREMSTTTRIPRRPPTAFSPGIPRCTAPWTKPSRAGGRPTPSAR